MEERTIREYLARRGFAHAPITCWRGRRAPVWMVLIWDRAGGGVAYLRGTLAEVLCGIARLPAA
jgi:hypothetical protein